MSNYDIVMDSNETLELDTIIKESNQPINPIKKVDTSVSYDKNNMDGILTGTAIFDPPEPGEYDIYINGQILSINVKDASKIPDLQDYNWNSLSGSYTNNSDYVEVSTTNTSVPSAVETDEVFTSGTNFEFDYWIYEHQKGVGIQVGPYDYSNNEFCGLYLPQGDGGSDSDNVLDILADDGNGNSVSKEIGSINTQTRYKITIDWNAGKSCTVTIDGVGSATVSSYVPNSNLPFVLHHQLGSSWSVSRGRIYYK